MPDTTPTLKERMLEAAKRAMVAVGGRPVQTQSYGVVPERLWKPMMAIREQAVKYQMSPEKQQEVENAITNLRTKASLYGMGKVHDGAPNVDVPMDGGFESVAQKYPRAQGFVERNVITPLREMDNAPTEDNSKLQYIELNDADMEDAKRRSLLKLE